MARITRIQKKEASIKSLALCFHPRYPRNPRLMTFPKAEVRVDLSIICFIFRTSDEAPRMFVVHSVVARD
jgi:hypothetical protein